MFTDFTIQHVDYMFREVGIPDAYTVYDDMAYTTARLRIEQNLSPGDPITGDGYSQEEATLPVYMPDAVKLFSESDFIRNSLGEELQRIFTLTKQQEIEEFRKRVTLLEHQSYLEQL